LERKKRQKSGCTTIDHKLENITEAETLLTNSD